jgi:hypothetical protein
MMTLLVRVTGRRRTARVWGGAKVLGGLHRPLRTFAPVLALTITRDDGNQILVGVRTPESNRTHQNVASVPTARVQPATAARWLRALRLNRAGSAVGRADLRNEVSHIFSRKLGLGDALELERIAPQVRGLSAVQGISVIGERDDGRLLTENLTMFNAHVVLDGPSDDVPPATASYRPLVWATVKSFVEMTHARDVGRLDATLDNAFYCAYGLCLETSARTLVAAGLADHPVPR